MKTLLTLFCSLACLATAAQNARTVVESLGLVIEDSTATDRLVLDATLRTFDIKINDSLTLRVDGSDPASVLLHNANSGIPIGMEVGSDGDYAFGEFSIPSESARSAVMSMRNGIFRPAPNTQAIATNSTERLRITDNGNIGIGTPVPIARLDVEGGIRIGFTEEDPTIDDLMVLDPVTGLVKIRHVSSLPPPMGGLTHDEQEQLKKQEVAIATLTERIEILESRLSQLEGDR